MNSDSKHVVVDNAWVWLCREGVQFMFECVAGLRGMAISKNENTTSGGCILADDMGYAKISSFTMSVYQMLEMIFSVSCSNCCMEAGPLLVDSSAEAFWLYIVFDCFIQEAFNLQSSVVVGILKF